jgi:Fur family ferric uptake transcriptional regulator
MEVVDKILNEKGVRITAMRQLILEYFLNEQDILGLGELEKIFSRSDRITIYRTLKTFEENGIVHSIENGPLEVKYALCDEYCSPIKHVDNHPHFHCLDCNQITCIEDIFIPPINLPAGYKVNEISMMIKGFCKNCSQ